MIGHLAVIAIAAAGEAKDTPLTNIKTIAETYQAVATGTALIVGGVWAYFRFVKERTYQPRIEVALSGQWLNVNEGPLLLARITVKNIGSSDIELVQRGTAFKVMRPIAAQPSAPSDILWQDVKDVPSWEIFLNHEWIEPNESISNDVLINLGVREPVLVLLWCRLVWRRGGEDRNIDVVTTQVLPPTGAVAPSAH